MGESVPKYVIKNRNMDDEPSNSCTNVILLNSSPLSSNYCQSPGNFSLRMGIPGNVQEEGHPVVAFLAAHITLEHVVVSVVAHVNCVEDGVLEGDITELALEHFGGGGLLSGRCDRVSPADDGSCCGLLFRNVLRLLLLLMGRRR